MEHLVRITRMSRDAFYQNLVELDAKKRSQILEPQLPLLQLSKYFSERTVTPIETPVPECTACGACCSFPLMVPVSMADSEHLSDILEITLDDAASEIVVERVLPRNAETGTCMHLAGTVGIEIGCSIYQNRPHVCHDFDAGSDRCHEYRRMYGLEPRLSDIDAAAATERLLSVERVDRIIDAKIVTGDTVTSFGYTVGDGGSWTSSETTRLKILVCMRDCMPFEICDFDPAQETWLESDLLGLTRNEAEELIAAKKHG